MLNTVSSMLIVDVLLKKTVSLIKTHAVVMSDISDYARVINM